jgi:DnaK suppressor protein
VPNAQSPLTDTQREALRGRLEDERRRISQVLRAPADTASAPDQTREIEELAQRETEASRQQDVAARERALLVEVERALAKLDAGTYGLSEKTGDPIPYERLRAVPWARQGVDE